MAGIKKGEVLFSVIETAKKLTRVHFCLIYECKLKWHGIFEQ